MYALVTGASSGLGEAIAKHLRETLKYQIIAVCRRQPIIKVDKFWKTDLTNYKDISRVADRMTTFPISLLVNNAGAMLGDITRFDSVNLHLLAPLAFMESMCMFPDSHIINIASVSGMKGEADHPIYSACKAGLIALTKSFAIRYASKNIMVNAISPGFFNTELFPGPTPQSMLDRLTLLKREAEPDMILPAVNMLLASEYTTGTNIIVDGGALLA